MKSLVLVCVSVVFLFDSFLLVLVSVFVLFALVCVPVLLLSLTDCRPAR